MNDNNFNSFTNNNSFNNGMNSFGNIPNGSVPNNAMQNQNPFGNPVTNNSPVNQTDNTNNNSKFFNISEEPKIQSEQDMMVGPNPFAILNSYEQENQNNQQNFNISSEVPTNTVPPIFTNNNPSNVFPKVEEKIQNNEAQNVTAEVNPVTHQTLEKFDNLQENSNVQASMNTEMNIESQPEAEVSNTINIETTNNNVENNTETFENPNLQNNANPALTENIIEQDTSSLNREESPETLISSAEEKVTEDVLTDTSQNLEETVLEQNTQSTFNTDEFETRFGLDYEKAISKGEAIFKGLKYRITVLSEILIRLEYSDSGTFEDRPTELARFRAFEVPKLLVTDEEKTLTIKTSYFELTYEKEKPFTGTKFSPDQYLKIKLLDTDKTWFFSQAEARNFRSTCSNLDDKYSIPKLEKGLYSTDGFVSLDDSKTLIFNEDGSVGKRSDARIDTYVFMYKKDFGFCLKDYYKLTGYPPLIPRYALGVWWNRDEAYNVNDIYSLLAKFKKYEIPLSVLLLNKWSDNDVTFNKEQIPEPKNVIEDLHREGIKLGIDLKLATVPATQNGERLEIPFNVYDRGFMANYFNTFIKPLNQMGVDFYSLNYRGEDKQILRMINYYFYNYMNNEPNKRGLILSRNGLINSHLYPIHNSGDIIVDWRTLKMIPEFNSTSSNLGISWWSHAIGGYKDGVEENELYTRFVELGAYSPIFRFSSAGGHYYKREPWRWDVKTRKIVKDYTNLRHKLIPYLYSESYKYSKTGLPLIQPLYYRYPELYDEPTYRNEYYFGTELFIAPITDRKDQVMNRTVVKLFLPNGMWYDFKTGKKFPGGKRYLSFFQDEDYPVFAKQGAIIPLADIDEKNRNFTGNPEAMEIHIFPGKNNTYKLYEDDGTSNAYQKGEFTTSAIDYNYLPNNYTVIIRPLEGKDGIIPALRKYKLRFRNTRLADDVIVYVGSERIQVKSYLDDQDFIVEVPPISTKEQLSVNCKGKDIEIDAVRIINEDIDTIISDLKIPTRLKERVSQIMFSSEEIKKKRIEIRKLASHGLNDIFVKMFLKLLEYVSEF